GAEAGEPMLDTPMTQVVMQGTIQSPSSAALGHVLWRPGRSGKEAPGDISSHGVPPIDLEVSIR
ncbi:MAG: hypothetical protein ACKPKO_23935, partial [Candidatus Fonsibacter sp.]